MSWFIFTPQHPSVIYRVGQVVNHKKWGYHGVIIGWDVKAILKFTYEFAGFFFFFEDERVASPSTS